MLPSVVSKFNDAAIARVNGGTQISAFKRVNGDGTTRTILAGLLFDLNDYYGLKQQMTGGQVRTTVEFIISEFWHLKIEQVAKAFHDMKAGRIIDASDPYKKPLKVYGELSPNLILTILHSYEQGVAGVYETDSVQFKEGYDSNRSAGVAGEIVKQKAAIIERIKIGGGNHSGNFDNIK